MSRVRADLLVAGLLPVVCVAALLAVDPDAGDRGDGLRRQPARSSLSTASVVCPSPVGKQAGTVGAATLSGASGEVLAGLGDLVEPVTLAPRQLTSVPAGAGPVVVTGVDDLAPSLVAGRSLEDPLAATDCRPPSAQQWFTGLGSGATHGSVIELVNPNAGRAVGDILLWSQAGPLDVPELLGISVPGGESVRLDLADVAPRRGELMAQVTTSRGRLAVDVRDAVDELGTGLSAPDWLFPQPEPTTSNLLLGLARGEGDRMLVLGNAGDDEVRATIKIVTPRAVFAPAGLEPVVVPPGTTKPLTLTTLLADATEQGAIGILVESTGPVTANLRQTAGDDLSEVAPAGPLDAPTAAVVPPGKARLLLADAEGVGLATVVALDATGKELATEKVELTPGTGASVALPDGTALVTLTPERTSVRAALLVAGGKSGTAVVQLRALLVDGLVPDVRPALP
jgi:hypothetical protein